MAVKKIKKVIKALKKASRSHASQAKTLKSVIRRNSGRNNTRCTFIKEHKREKRKFFNHSL